MLGLSRNRQHGTAERIASRILVLLQQRMVSLSYKCWVKFAYIPMESVMVKCVFEWITTGYLMSSVTKSVYSLEATNPEK